MSCLTLSARSPYKFPINVKYIGFEIEDRFVVGYGLDYAEKYREIPLVAKAIIIAKGIINIRP